MTLSSALSSSIRGLSTAQDSITLISNNIANANTDGYIRQEAIQEAIVTSGSGQGSRIVGISTDVDKSLLISIREQNAIVGKVDTLRRYSDDMSKLFGNPNNGNSFSDGINNFFAALQELSDNPDLSSVRQNALNQTISLESNISNTARGIEKLRLKADREIEEVVGQINSLIGQIYSNNLQAANLKEGTEGRANLEQQRIQRINALSELVDISVTTDNLGKVSIIEKGTGLTLLDDNRRELSYTAAGSEESFINDTSLIAITVFPLDEAGVRQGNGDTLLPAGRSSEIVSRVSSGVLQGLISMRDTEMPKVLEQLDVLAEVITDEINAVHNDGTSFPGVTSLTGTKSTVSNTEIGFSGKVLIAVVNSDGSPVTSPYGDEQYYKPLTLDLGSLNSGSGAGLPTPDTIVAEINEYYGPPQARASVGNLRDISIASTSTSITDGNSFTFDFQLDSVAADDSIFSVTSLTVNNGADGLTSALPAAYTLSAGERARTGSANQLTVDLNNGTGGPYTLTAGVSVTDSSGTVTTATITFSVDADGTEGLNDRIRPTSVTQTSVAGSASFIAAPSAARFAQATYVDALGNEVGVGQAGFLKIETASSSYTVAIDELDSQEVGTSSTATADITNRGFSHYFGLNNLFVENADTENSAVNFAIRSDISTNSNMIATGDLTLSNQPSDTNSALYTYESSNGSSNIARRMAAVSETVVVFPSAGSFPQTSNTIGGYTNEIIGFTALNANNNLENFEVEKLGAEGLNTLFQDQVGVNIDNELAEVINVENNYRASAQVINTIRNLFDVLQSIF